MPPLLVQRGGAGLGHHQVLDHNLCARFQSTDQAAEYPCRVLVGSVVEDAAEEVHLCPFDWLLGEEVVRHVLQAAVELGGDSAAGYGAGEVLYDACDVGQLFGQSDTRWSVGTTYVDEGKGAGAELSPWVAV